MLGMLGKVKDKLSIRLFDEFQHSDENPACLALISNASYERSGDDINKLDERGKSADEWYEYFKDYE